MKTTRVNLPQPKTPRSLTKDEEKKNSCSNSWETNPPVVDIAGWGREEGLEIFDRGDARVLSLVLVPGEGSLDYTGTGTG